MSAPAVGTRLPELEVPAVSAEKMKTMAALLADPTPIHFDPAAVAAAGLGDRPVNQGPLNVGYVMNLLARFAGGHERLRRIRVRFMGTVFAGDRLVAGGVVTGVREEGGTRLVDCDVTLRVVGREPDLVLSGTATVELPREGGQ